MLKYRHMPHLTDCIARSLRGPVMSSTQKRAILQVRIREEDKQHAERLYDAMGNRSPRPYVYLSRRAF